ncbi:MAG TPA: CAP domain-containing protein [Actinokineospora sp.]|jgi:uncharacterized protein YkwD|nr:CAP domain-containing protein [Actinokineospora sp.]
MSVPLTLITRLCLAASVLGLTACGSPTISGSAAVPAAPNASSTSSGAATAPSELVPTTTSETTTSPAAAPMSTTATPASKSTPKPVVPAKPAPQPAPRTADGVTFHLEQELVTELNKRRVALGLKPVQFAPELATAAGKCVVRNLSLPSLDHCGHEVLWASGGGLTTVPDPKKLLDAWMASPGHRTALTYASSTRAGGSLAGNSKKTVAAININY